MNKLRSLASAILLVGGPSIASATCLVDEQACVVTNGSMTFSVFDTGASFSVGGVQLLPGGGPSDVNFSLSGGMAFGGNNPLSTTSPVGSLGAWAVGSTLELTLHADANNGGLSGQVGGVPLPAAEFFVDFTSPPSPIPGGNSLPEPQLYRFDEPFQFGTLVRNPAGPDCGFPTPSGPVNCWGFSGQGNVTFDAIPTAPNSDAVYILDATYIFTNPFAKAPEPSTTSLLLLGFVALVILSRRANARAA